MSVREYLVRILSVDIAIPEKIVDAVVAHQFQSANEAMDVNHSLEISGFGKFVFNTKKAHKRMATLIEKKAYYNKELEAINLTDVKKAKIVEIIRVIDKQIEQIKPKLNHD